MPKREPLALPEEVAEYLRVEPETLKEWRRLGKGPRFIRRNGRPLYDWADVDEYLKPTAAPAGEGTAA